MVRTKLLLTYAAQRRWNRKKRQNETEEQRANRKFKAKLNYIERLRNETNAERERRIAMCTRRSALVRRKARLRRQRAQDTAPPETALAPNKMRKKPGRSRRTIIIENEIGDVICSTDPQEAEMKLEPEMKAEPCIVMENADITDETVQEIIEIGGVVKQEQLLENLVTNTVEKPKSEAGFQSSTSTPFTERVQNQTLPGGTAARFSRRTSLRTKAEALKYIQMLEEFALLKENFRLIGFTERLQLLIKEGP